MTLFLISAMVLDLSNQLQIFLQLYLITVTVPLDVTKAFNMVWHAGLLHKLKPYGISSQMFGLISSFLNNRQLRVLLDGTSLQEYPVNAGVPQATFLVSRFSYYTLMPS